MTKITMAIVLITTISCLSAGTDKAPAETTDSLKLDSIRLDSLKQAELNSLGPDYIFEND